MYWNVTWNVQKVEEFCSRFARVPLPQKRHERRRGGGVYESVRTHLDVYDLNQRQQQLLVHLPVTGEELVRVDQLIAEQKEPEREKKKT